MIKQITLVALGGGMGSALRYLSSLWFTKHFSYAFPIGTFAVNIVGSFIIGLLIGLSTCYDIFDKELRLLLIVGFCGGYTTFSTFSLDSLKLFENGDYWPFALYIVSNITLGILVVIGGNILAKSIISVMT
ncbi:MAG: fluoride efflux transporter CrcB [Bacteroidales bacterium]